jgi:dTDP-glucose 4,6-dehydratase
MIWNLDALTYAGSLENLKNLPDPERHIFLEGDICDQPLIEKTLREHKIDTTIHFAAESHVDRSIEGPGEFVRTNIQGTFSLLEAARKVWLDEGQLPRAAVRFHHVSTDEVYGSLEQDALPFTEETPYDPNSPYAASKAASDHLVRAYGHTYDLPFTITNCSNNYGPYQFPEKLIPLMILNALQGEPLPIYGDGLQIRDWLHVEDHCEALLIVLRKGRVGETYNIGGDNQPTNLEIVQKICAILDELVPDSDLSPRRALIQFVADRPGHDRRYAMDIGKIRSNLGWEPRHDMERGLRQTVVWYLENRDWLDAIILEKNFQSWLAINYERRGE